MTSPQPQQEEQPASQGAGAGPSSQPASAPAEQLTAPPTPSIESLPTFASISHLLSPPILLALSSLRFSHPTPVQAQVLPLALSGHDIVARARTGSGKTLAYALPILQKVIKAKEALGKSSPDYQRTRALILVPTRELAEQVSHHVARVAQSSNEDIAVVNVAREASPSVHKLLLGDRPDVVVATPSRALSFVQSKALPLDALDSLVLDEADLLLSYGHDSAVRALFAGNVLPKTYQSFLMSATMSKDVQELRGLLAAGGRKAQVLDLKDPTHHAHLTQYYVYLSEDSKFLLLYVLLKLRLVRGKCLIFVNDVDRGFKLRLFLEAFGVRSCVLNAEMPANSRYHIVQEFNKGVYDIIIATDEGSESTAADADAHLTADAETDGGEGGENEVDDEEAGDDDAASDDEDHAEASSKKRKRGSDKDKKKGKAKKGPVPDAEYGVSRGIDFVAVSCVVNFDLPTSLSSYIHRIGRTARAHSVGIALSFIVPSAKNSALAQHPSSAAGPPMKGLSSPTSHRDERTWRKISRYMRRLAPARDTSTAGSAAGAGPILREWRVDWALVSGFRYRMEDALRSTTRAKVTEARRSEIKAEVLRSERLRAHFEDNPRDYAYLRHDRAIDAGKGGKGRESLAHLKHVPGYLLPGRGALKAPKPVNLPGEQEGGGAGGSRVSYDEQGRSLGYVGMRKHPRGGSAGARGRGRGRGRGGAGGSGGRKKDPLRVGKK